MGVWKTEYNKNHGAWQKENTVNFSLRLFKQSDADIIKALEGKKKGTEIKRLVRIGLAHDIQSDIHTDESGQE